MNTFSLGERIKKARVEKGLTQQVLAERLGIAYPTLNKYEKGHRTPDAALLNQMVNILGCEPGWLLTGEGPKERGGGETGREPGPGYNPQVLGEVITTVEELFKEHNLYLAPDKKAELITLLYEDLLEHEELKPELRGRVLRFMKLAS